MMFFLRNDVIFGQKNDIHECFTNKNWPINILYLAEYTTIGEVYRGYDWMCKYPWRNRVSLICDI